MILSGLIIKMNLIFYLHLHVISCFSFVDSYGCETWLLGLKEEKKMK